MKIAPVSGDLLIKLSMAAAAVLVVVWAGRKAADAAGAAWAPLATYGNALGIALNPASDGNLAYQGASGLTSLLTGDTSFGGWLYSATHADPLAAPAAPVLPAVNPKAPPMYDYTPGIY